MPTEYLCQRCTACCRWPGFVRVADDEIARLAQWLSRADHDFIQEFTRTTHDRRGLALTEQANGDCIFLIDGACLVHDVKPRQCRDFPNGWNFPGFERICRATPIPAA